jgi:hypothetical protein
VINTVRDDSVIVILSELPIGSYSGYG